MEFVRKDEIEYLKKLYPNLVVTITSKEKSKAKRKKHYIEIDTGGKVMRTLTEYRNKNIVK